jgi:heavy metal sensor kinase
MRSLRLKLILGSLLVLGIVIISFGVFVYLAESRTLLSAMDNRLVAVAQAMASHVEFDQGRLVFAPAEDYDIQRDLPPAFRIVDPEGKEIASSTNEFPQDWPAERPDEGQTRLTTTGSADDGRWRVITLSSRITDEQDSVEEDEHKFILTATVTIQGAEPLDPVSEELRELASQLAMLGLAVFLVAGGGSFLLAGRALRPIRRINEALANVSETRLDERLDPGPFDKELHPLVDQLNAALGRLEEAFRRERQFTADVSHELRTPVAGILNTIEVLLRRPREAEELKEGHEDNLRIARSMESMIGQLLLLARMDAGKARPEKRPTPLAPFIDQVFAESEPEARERGLQLIHDIDPSLCADIDPDQMKIAVGNLIDNAIRYNRPKGRVTVRASHSPEGLVMEIEDSGIGIPADHLSRIFDRFHRVDPSRSEESGGCGLGLSIAKKIVEAHSGRISASSGPEGSTFTVVLPGAAG